jgi:hypothetical protein
MAKLVEKKPDRSRVVPMYLFYQLFMVFNGGFYVFLFPDFKFGQNYCGYDQQSPTSVMGVTDP